MSLYQNPSEQLNIARDAVVERCLHRAILAATRLTYSLLGVRDLDSIKPDFSDHTSLALDDLVGNSRTVADICAHSTQDQAIRESIKSTLTELNGLYAHDTVALAEGRIATDFFMQGAEELSLRVQRNLQTLTVEFERARQSARPVNAPINESDSPRAVMADIER